MSLLPKQIRDVKLLSNAEKYIQEAERQGTSWAATKPNEYSTNKIL